MYRRPFRLTMRMFMTGQTQRRLPRPGTVVQSLFTWKTVFMSPFHSQIVYFHFSGASGRPQPYWRCTLIVVPDGCSRHISGKPHQYAVVRSTGLIVSVLRWCVVQLSDWTRVIRKNIFAIYLLFYNKIVCIPTLYVTTFTVSDKLLRVVSSEW